jgi:acetolactate synthase I/III small subunit
MKHTLSVLVNDHPGVLSRVAGLFTRRGFNIASISVGASETPEVSRITIVADADEDTLEQITKQLHKLIDVIKIQDITAEASVDRMLALIKVGADTNSRPEVMQIVDIFRAKVVDVGEKAVIIEATGDEEKVSAIIKLLRPYGIKEIVQTGKIAMVRSK